MAYDKVVDSTLLDNGLESIANSIRKRSGTTTPLTFPKDFSSAIEAIPGTKPPEYPEYTGEYVIIPQAESETILDTQNKVLKDNVTVQKVPYFDTSNEFGNTIYIASEVQQ